jgi:hypothetical protein
MQNDKNNISYLTAEIDRSLLEIRTSLGATARRGNLPAAMMSLSTLIDRVECTVTEQNGDSAFELSDDGNKVCFRASTLASLIDAMEILATEIDDNEDGAIRIRQMAFNLFIIHELLHIRQNFPDFATVAKIKEGTGGIGLPMLDVAADTLSAYVCAHIECDRTGQQGDDDLLLMYVNCLMIAYVVGAFVYDGRTNPAKRQRLLGLVISAMLVQAKLEGRLDFQQISESWQPMSPIFALDLNKAGTFNALVIDQMLGLLLHDHHPTDPEQVADFWDGVGKRPIYEIMLKASRLLIATKAIKP